MMTFLTFMYLYFLIHTMCLGLSDKRHYVDGKIFCHDDFILSGYSDEPKVTCIQCGDTIFGRMIQVVVVKN